MPLFPCFHLHLNHAIRPGLVTVGRYDGVHDSLTCATSGGKLFTHAPHTSTTSSDHGDGEGNALAYLNVNQAATALAAGPLDPDLGRDVLVAGLGTSLMAYDVEQNRDMFYKEVPDGVSALAIGTLGKMTQPLAIAGGNCTLQGFDALGNDQYWTVTGDNVTSVLLHDVTSDGSLELITASEDYDIRVFQEEQVQLEVSEDDVVRRLAPLHGGRFAYGLSNGTIGVYQGTERQWRVKSKNQVVSMTSFDLDNDGIPELITGWSNGKVDVRHALTGEVVFKDTLTAPIAGVVLADYRNDGTSQVVACSEDGEMRGYKAADKELQGNLLDRDVDADALAELRQTKQELLFELKTYEDNLRAIKERSKGVVDTSGASLPANVSIRTAIDRDVEAGCVRVMCSSSTPHVVIVGVVLASDTAFENGASCRFAARPDVELSINVQLSKDEATCINVRVIAAPRARLSAMQVYESKIDLPRFAALVMARDCEMLDSVRTSVSFRVPERRQRIALWLKNRFILEHVPELEMQRDLDLRFRSVRTKSQMLRVCVSSSGSTTSDVVFTSDDVDLLGNLVQDLCDFINVSELESTAELPDEVLALQALMSRVASYNAARQRISAELAEGSNMVKAMVIKAEDSRLLGDMAQMRRAYSNLYAQNMDLIREYRKRANNHSELLASLREINQTIQRASRLRYGPVKARLISACRQAVKANNVTGLASILTHGK